MSSTGIEKLTAENWTCWKMQVEAYLTGEGWWEQVDPATLISGKVDEEKKAKAFAFMVRHCSTAIVSDLALKGHNVSKCPREMWNYLVARFEKVSGTTKMIAFNKLVDTKMDINNVEKFISEYEKGIQVARMAGINLSDEIIYLRFVHQICDELEATRNRLQEKDDFEEAKEILRAETKRYLEKEKSETALKATWRTGGRQNNANVPFCGKCGMKGHWTKDCNPQAVKCYGCGQCGHIVAKCPEKGKSVNNNASKYVCSSFVSLFSNTRSNEYYLDSGASDHFINEQSAFTGLKQMHSTVTTAEGKKSVITGVGDVTLKNVTLKNAKLVPEFRTNLISVARLCEDGLKVEFCGTTAEVKRKEATVLSGTARHRVFVVKEEETCFGAAEEWHRRLNHPGATRTQLIRKENPQLPISTVSDCDACLRGKAKQQKYPKADSRASAPLELVHTDVGFMPVAGLRQEKCFVIFVDDYSKLVRVFPMKAKSEVAAKLKEYIIWGEAITGNKLKRLRSDCAREYLHGEFSRIAEEKGIFQEHSTAYCHQQNGVAERFIQKLKTTARVLLIQANAPLKLWPEALKHAAWTDAAVPHTGTNESPYECFYGKKAPMERLRPFGCVAYAHVPEAQRNMLQPTARKTIFLGYPYESSNYYVYDPETRRVAEARNVTFKEEFYFSKQDGAVQAEGEDSGQPDSSEETTPDVEGEHQYQPEEEEEADSETEESSSEEEDTITEEEASEQTLPKQIESEPAAAAEQQQQNTETVAPPLRRSERERRRPAHLDDYVCGTTEENRPEPRSYSEAIASDDAEEWTKAMTDEWSSFEVHQTGDIVDAPPGKKIVKGKWVFKSKNDSESGKSKKKARYVACGYSQVAGIDYDETFSPVVNFDTVRVALTVAAAREYSVRQFDVKTAYLHAELKETIYMEMPEGFRVPGKVLKLKKAVYGLKQSARCWNEHIQQIFVNNQLTQSTNDQCLYYNNNKELYVLLYVDDLLILSKEKKDADQIKQALAQKLELKEIQKVERFCGVEINVEDGKFLLSQTLLIDELVGAYGLTEGREYADSPLPEWGDYSEGEADLNLPIKNLIGSLQFIASRTRPDIAASLNYLSRQTSKPTQRLFNACKYLLRYVKKTRDLKLVLGRQSQEGLVIFTDASHAPLPDRKSITGVVVQLFGSTVAWASKKQPTEVALSSSEAEYYAMSRGVSEGLWMSRLISELGEPKEKFVLKCDNQSAIGMLKNRPQKDAKHIDVRKHFILENHLRKRMEVEYVPAAGQKADYLTKAMSPVTARKAQETLLGSRGSVVKW